MIPSHQILTVGPDIRRSKGGVAQCISTYAKTIFSHFRLLTNSCDGNLLRKLSKALTSLISFYCLLATDHRIRIVHIHTASNNSFRRSALFVNAAKLMHRRVIIHIHGGGFREYYTKQKKLVFRILSRCDATIVLSQSWKDFVQGTIGVGNVYVVPNIIDYPVKKEHLPNGLFHLFFMGHIRKEKGIFDLLQLINENHEQLLGSIVLHIAGGLFDEQTLRKYISDNHIQDIVHFHGWVTGDKKTELLNLADAFILPSYAEGMPISILEAESYGIPIISTPVGGVPDIVTDGGNGILITPGDKKSMLAAIQRLMHDPVLCKKMGNESLKKSLNYLPPQIEKALIQVYSNL